MADLKFTLTVDITETLGILKQMGMMQVIFRKIKLADIQ